MVRVILAKDNADMSNVKNDQNSFGRKFKVFSSRFGQVRVNGYLTFN